MGGFAHTFAHTWDKEDLQEEALLRHPMPRKFGENTGLSAKSLANLRPPWVPGVSGNPGGRPKELFRPVVRRLAELTVEEIAKVAASKPSMLELIVLGQIEAATKGNPAAFGGLADRSDGKVPVAVTVPEDEGVLMDAETALKVAEWLLRRAGKKKGKKEE